MAKKLKLRRQTGSGNGSSPGPGLGGLRDWYEPETGRGPDRSGLGGESEEDNVGGRPGSEHDSRGSRGVSGRSGGSGSFERESDDYARNMGNEDRGRMSGESSERDDDFASLGRQSRFGNQGDQGGDPGNRDGSSSGGVEGERGKAQVSPGQAQAPRRVRRDRD